MINFCTLFDSNYLARGLALHESLCRVCPSFHLYVIAFDNNCYEFLLNSGLAFLTPISLSDFENEELLRIKNTRTAAEYCWTCTPSAIAYCLEKFNLPSCTYLDADLIFYLDPNILFEELGTNSVLISEHHYTKEYDVSLTHGIYCVQFMYFKKDDTGLSVLYWWRDRCLEWCFNYMEGNKFGDQKYLDDWPLRFKGVHVLQHQGGGIAPWNIQQYSLLEKSGKVYISNRKYSTLHPLAFYHFHGLKFFSDQWVACTGTMYELSPQVKEILYFPYISKLLSIEKSLLTKGIDLNPNGAKRNAPAKLFVLLHFLKERLLLISKGRISALDFSKFDFSLYYHFYPFIQFKSTVDGISYRP